MKRYGSSNDLADDFGYSYFSGTNKLQTIGEGLTAYNYTYDKNGNMTSDQLNRTGSIKYDHRNLMTEIRAIKTEANPDPFGVPTIDVLYLTNYRYDEAGNRISKIRYKYTGSTPDPIFEEGDNIDWTLQSSEYYVRDVSGKEIAIYSGSSLTQWNIWGLDNVGKINADTTRNYYLKDHLGSIRVVLNSSNAVVSAQDYDAWGYPLENRTYNVSAMKYDFTGKERDDETSYDYFGARYYDSRIGRWGGVEPLLDKYPSATPYCYSLDNPILFKDFNGMDLTIGGDKSMALNDLKSMFVDVDIQNRITADDNGVISFNVKGLNITSDAAITMLHFMVNVSDNKYLYEYADQTTVTVREGNDLYEKGQSRTIGLDEDSYIFNGEINVSKTPFNVDGGLGNSGELPKLNYDGQVTLGSGNWITNLGKGNIESRHNIVFHALAENYFRTEAGLPHHRADWSGAHQESIHAANRNFKNNTSIDPGHNVLYKP